MFVLQKYNSIIICVGILIVTNYGVLKGLAKVKKILLPFCYKTFIYTKYYTNLLLNRFTSMFFKK